MYDMLFFKKYNIVSSDNLISLPYAVNVSECFNSKNSMTWLFYPLSLIGQCNEEYSIL